jgi:tRNA-modifying protein YgfZ
MSTDAPPRAGLLKYLGVLRFTGADSLSFLQGQVSGDTRRLAQGHGLLAAYSSPQGRVLALMHLLPHSSGTLAILPRDLVLPTLEALRKFVLRAKVKIEDASETLGVSGQYGVHGLEASGLPVPTSDTPYLEKDGIGVAVVNKDPGRYWVIAAPGVLAELGLVGDPDPGEQARDPALAEQALELAPAGQGLADGRLHAGRVEQDWRLSDIRAGLPQIYLATREAFVAQMLNLDLLDGISFTKGCYTGQEIIARTQHLGRIKRRLYRLRLPAGDWVVGQALRLTDGRAGRLIEVVETGQEFEALAVLPVESAAASGAAEGDPGTSRPVAATQLAIPYQL